MERCAKPQATGQTAADLGGRLTNPEAWKVSEVGKNTAQGVLPIRRGAPGAGLDEQGHLPRSTAGELSERHEESATPGTADAPRVGSAAKMRSTATSVL